jgi:hypothetical protein
VFNATFNNEKNEEEKINDKERINRDLTWNV